MRSSVPRIVCLDDSLCGSTDVFMDVATRSGGANASIHCPVRAVLAGGAAFARSAGGGMESNAVRYHVLDIGDDAIGHLLNEVKGWSLPSHLTVGNGEEARVGDTTGGEDFKERGSLGVPMGRVALKVKVGEREGTLLSRRGESRTHVNRGGLLGRDPF